MKHEVDYEDSTPGRDYVIYSTPRPPWQLAPVVHLTGYQSAKAVTIGTTVHRRLDIRPAPEILQEQIDELRRRVVALESLARYDHDQ